MVLLVLRGVIPNGAIVYQLIINRNRKAK
jgi:hypothetical protein